MSFHSFVYSTKIKLNFNLGVVNARVQIVIYPVNRDGKPRTIFDYTATTLSSLNTSFAFEVPLGRSLYGNTGSNLNYSVLVTTPSTTVPVTMIETCYGLI